MTARGLLADRRVRWVAELLALLVGALGIALLVESFVVKPYQIPTGSMEPTLVPHQRVLVDRIGHDFSPPSLGSIVVFHPPTGADAEACDGTQPAGAVCDTGGRRASSEYFIKRVVGLPGDTIAIRNGQVIRNGRLERAPYARACDLASVCDFPTTVRIPRGDYFMMGDNRPNSDDSRFWGPVPNSWIIGTAFATYWPPDRIGTL